MTDPSARSLVKRMGSLPPYAGLRNGDMLARWLGRPTITERLESAAVFAAAAFLAWAFWQVLATVF